MNKILACLILLGLVVFKSEAQWPSLLVEELNEDYLDLYDDDVSSF